MTNSDWIRSLADMQLAEYINSVYLTGKLVAQYEFGDVNLTTDYLKFESVIDWLQAERED